MSSFLNFVFGVVLIILWIISGGLVTQANIYLDSDNFRESYRYTFWAAFVTWFLIALFIILVVLSIVGVVALFGSGAGEAGLAIEEGSLLQTDVVGTGISWFTIGFLVLALILVGTTGVLAAMAAASLSKNPYYNASNSRLKKAYDDCIIAASLCLGAGGLLIIGIIAYFTAGARE